MADTNPPAAMAKKPFFLVSFLRWLGSVIVGAIQTVLDFFLDKNGQGDEKRLWGAVYLAAALVYIFWPVMTLNGPRPPASDVLKILGIVGIALLSGAVVGDRVQTHQQTASAVKTRNPLTYLWDLMTNKDGQGDALRVFGNLFMLGGVVYTFLPGAPDAGMLTIITALGGALLGVAIFGDVFGPMKITDQVPPTGDGSPT